MQAARPARFAVVPDVGTIRAVDRLRTFARQRPRLMAWAFAWLLLSQWLALAHGIVHLPGGGTPALVRCESLPAASFAEQVCELVGGHADGSITCHAVDQLCLGASGGAAAFDPGLPDLLPVQVGRAQLLAQRPAWRRALARAPPIPAQA